MAAQALLTSLPVELQGRRAVAPVTLVLVPGLMPTTSTSSPGFTIPVSMRPVATAGPSHVRISSPSTHTHDSVSRVLVRKYSAKLNSHGAESTARIVRKLRTAPVATVPRPWMEKTSSMGMRKGLSSARVGSGMWASTAAISCWMASLPSSGLLSSSAHSAEPLHTVAQLIITALGHTCWVSCA